MSYNIPIQSEKQAPQGCMVCFHGSVSLSIQLVSYSPTWPGVLLPIRAILSITTSLWFPPNRCSYQRLSSSLNEVKIAYLLCSIPVNHWIRTHTHMHTKYINTVWNNPLSLPELWASSPSVFFLEFVTASLVSLPFPAAKYSLVIL